MSSGVQGFVWQLKDRSESGCRLRGRIVNSNRVLPGALVALREHDNVPWTLAVVRRLRKRMGDRIDIGVEYVGQNPLVVNLAVDVDRIAAFDGGVGQEAQVLRALHLQESSGHPHLPFKTLILSAREFNAGRCLSLRSDGAEYTVRLKEPIEEQDGFVWLPYELVFRLATDGQTQGRPLRRQAGACASAELSSVRRPSCRSRRIGDSRRRSAAPAAQGRPDAIVDWGRSPLCTEREQARSAARASGLDHQADAMRPVAAIDLPRLLTVLPMVAASRAG